jgi:yecA family protein
MHAEPDYDLGLLPAEDIEKLDRILDDRSKGIYGAPALHGFLVASAIGPEPIPKLRILETALASEDPGDFEDFAEFGWVGDKVDEWVGRINRVFREQPRAFTLLVHQPRLKEGETTPDPESWCRGFLEAMQYQEEAWTPFLEAPGSMGILAPIVFTARGGAWEVEDVPNPFAHLDLTPSQMCEVLQVSVLGIRSFWNDHQPKVEPGSNGSSPHRS